MILVATFPEALKRTLPPKKVPIAQSSPILNLKMCPEVLLSTFQKNLLHPNVSISQVSRINRSQKILPGEVVWIYRTKLLNTEVLISENSRVSPLKKILPKANLSIYRRVFLNTKVSISRVP
jgi:hypothetical protein